MTKGKLHTAGASMRDGNQTFQMMLENMVQGVYLIRMSDMTIVYANPALERMFGYDQNELEGQHVGILFTSDETPPEATWDAIKAELLSTGFWDGEVHHVGKNGTPFGRRVYMTVWDDPRHGRICQSVYTDITGRKQVEETLNLFRRSFMSSSEAIAVSDSKGRLLYANPAHNALFGQTPEEAKGCNYRDYYPPESIEVLDREVAPALRRGESWQGILDVYDKNGRLFSLWERADSVLDENGDMLFAVGFMHDDTERIRTDQRLYERILSATPDLISMIDNHYVYRFVNDSYLKAHGKRRREIVGCSVIDLHGRGPFERIIKRRLDRCLDGETIHYQEWFQYKSWGRKFMDVTYSPYVAKGGSIVGIVVGAHDVTTLKQMELELRSAREAADMARDAAESADRAKTEFLHNMTHEVRTPMNSIMGFSAMLQSQIENPEHLGYLKTIQSSGRQLVRLIDNILDLARVETRTLAINLQPVSVEELFHDIDLLFSSGFQAKGIQFYLSIETPLKANLMLDRARIRQILISLVDNALKFTHEGHVKLSAHIHPKEDRETQKRVELTFQVEDTGIGIPHDQHWIIFDDFIQQDGSVTRKYGGVGIGLSLSKKLAEMMGGTISVESQVGWGSTFHVFFPDVEVARETSPTVAACAETHTAVGPCHQEALFDQHPAECVISLDELIRALENECIPRWKELKKVLVLDELDSLADTVNQLGLVHHCELLTTWCATLRQQVNAADFEKVKKTLNQFPLLLHQLKCLRDKN